MFPKLMKGRLMTINEDGWGYLETMYGNLINKEEEFSLREEKQVDERLEHVDRLDYSWENNFLLIKFLEYMWIVVLGITKIKSQQTKGFLELGSQLGRWFVGRVSLLHSRQVVKEGFGGIPLLLARLPYNWSNSTKEEVFSLVLHYVSL